MFNKCTLIPNTYSKAKMRKREREKESKEMLTYTANSCTSLVTKMPLLKCPFRKNNTLNCAVRYQSTSQLLIYNQTQLQFQPMECLHF